MDQQNLVEQPPSSILTFFRRIAHRFVNGNGRFNESYNSVHNDFSSSWGLTYDSHPGPINDALEDAKNSNRSLFIFIYSKENALTQKFIATLSSAAISEEMRRSFIFLPLDATTFEGLSVANALRFHSLPLIALVRPRGDSLEESQIFVKHEGKMGESTLLSYIRIEVREDQEVVVNQNGEYQEALREEQEMQREVRVREEEEERKEEEMKRVQDEVNEAFDNLPQPPEDQSNIVTIKFQFPNNNNNQIRAFPRDGPTSMLFVFARKFVYPMKFVIRAGFPLQELEESDKPLSEICQERQFICYVEPE
jgi:FAS-associated factor 2